MVEPGQPNLEAGPMPKIITMWLQVQAFVKIE